MAKKRRVADADAHLTQMTRTEAGYEVVIDKFHFKLPNDKSIHQNAVKICAGYDQPDSEAVQILKRSTLTLELVNTAGVFENLIGVVLFAIADDAERLKQNPELYGDIMGAIGEACPSIGHDRIEIVNEQPKTE